MVKVSLDIILSVYYLLRSSMDHLIVSVFIFYISFKLKCELKWWTYISGNGDD